MLQPVAGLFGMVSHHTNMLVSLATTWYCDKSFHDYAMKASAALTWLLLRLTTFRVAPPSSTAVQ